jgi:hypothetical protein
MMAEYDVEITYAEANVISLIGIVIIYGIYKFVSLGVSLDHYLYTYILLFGGLAATVGFFIYIEFLRRSRRGLLMLLGYIPYLFSLYVIGFLGVYGLYMGLFQAFSIWSIVAGLIWIVIGYQITNKFHQTTEIIRIRDHKKSAERS